MPRPPWEGIDVYDFLVELEPMKHGVRDMPIKSITYSSNRIEIEIYTQEEFDRLWIDWDEL